jgi:putative PIN family toxin of toxin-antitoxin system
VAPLRFVFDTNVVIDWLVFNDDYLHRLRERIAVQDVAVLRNELALVELTRVLGYEALKLAPLCQADVRSRYVAQTIDAQMPPDFAFNSLLLPERFPRCRDSDDDAFLALAFHSRATALITRDKALLKLKKRARRFEVTILSVQEMMGIVGA